MNGTVSFQSPFHRGNGCYGCEETSWVPGSLLSFQSPFHRGNGCYNSMPATSVGVLGLSVPFSSGQWLLQGNGKHLSISGMIHFQSPFHRGNGCYSELHYQLSVSLTSGQWLLSPLFIGAMVATHVLENWIVAHDLSVPFSSGQWLLHSKRWAATRKRCLSVPFSSGQWLLL